MLKPFPRFGLILLACLSSPVFAETIILKASGYIDVLNGDLLYAELRFPFTLKK